MKKLCSVSYGDNPRRTIEEIDESALTAGSQHKPGWEIATVTKNVVISDGIRLPEYNVTVKRLLRQEPAAQKLIADCAANPFSELDEVESFTVNRR